MLFITCCCRNGRLQCKHFVRHPEYFDDLVCAQGRRRGATATTAIAVRFNHAAAAKPAAAAAAAASASPSASTSAPDPPPAATIRSPSLPPLAQLSAQQQPQHPQQPLQQPPQCDQPSKPRPAPPAAAAAAAPLAEQVRAGFAKLHGEDFEYFVQSYSIVLGRNSKKSSVDLDLSALGGGMNVSRNHAKIFYDFAAREFRLEVLGKNGVYVDGQPKSSGSDPVPLKSQQLLQVGDKRFFFLLPAKNPQPPAKPGPLHQVRHHPG
ncbi:hypothetical protein CLOM_g23520 [Closterium sp. NIES-68]|nr:hypothetical protein CLOM_g23520 [Closterium sp. NIES-68]